MRKSGLKIDQIYLNMVNSKLDKTNNRQVILHVKIFPFKAQFLSKSNSNIFSRRMINFQIYLSRKQSDILLFTRRMTELSIV